MRWLDQCESFLLNIWLVASNDNLSNLTDLNVAFHIYVIQLFDGSSCKMRRLDRA